MSEPELDEAIWYLYRALQEIDQEDTRITGYIGTPSAGVAARKAYRRHQRKVTTRRKAWLAAHPGEPS